VAARTQDSRNDRFIDRHRASIAVAELLAGAIIGLYAEHMFGWILGRSRDAVASAAILGVSVGFAAITGACCILLAARINAFTAMVDETAETRRYVERRLMHASAISEYRQISTLRSE
jgi:hypothetical protein